MKWHYPVSHSYLICNKAVMIKGRSKKPGAEPGSVPGSEPGSVLVWVTSYQSRKHISTFLKKNNLCLESSTLYVCGVTSWPAAISFHIIYKHNVCCIIVSHWKPEDINNNVLQYNTDKTKIPCWWQV